MPLTRDYRQTVYENLRRSSTFRREMLKGALETMLEGEVDAGKIILRDFVNGTVGFPELARVMGKSPKSLMRMLSPTGNPQAKNLFELVSALQRHEGVRLELRSVKAAA